MEITNEILNEIGETCTSIRAVGPLKEEQTTRILVHISLASFRHLQFIDALSIETRAVVLSDRSPCRGHV